MDPPDLRNEIADVFCRVVLLALHDVDLSTEIEQKWLAWNP